MGRKAKDAAQRKIGEWTGARRNMSKTTTKSENANASNENRTPLQTHSQSDINAMKNCTVRLENIRTEPKMIDTERKIPAKPVPTVTAATTNVIAKKKQADAKNVYDDYSFDGDDIPGPMKKTDDEMKDLFEKLAKNNIIEVKKYRPKNVKKTKSTDKVPDKKIQKRRREKHPIEVEPPQKKANLKTKVAMDVTQKSTAISSTKAATASKGNIDAENVANNNVSAEKAIHATKPSVNMNSATRIGLRQQLHVEHVSVQPRLRNRNQNFQSTPKSSTPLGVIGNGTSKENNRSLNTMFFDNASPLVGSTRSTRGKHRLQLSAINDSQENVASEGKSNENLKENTPQVNYMDDGDFDFGNNEPEPDNDDVDKENSLDRPSTSAAALSRPSTSAAALNQPSTSAAALSRPNTNLDELNRPSTSTVAQNRPSHNNSVFKIQDATDYNIYSPTKRRVYGRSPLKNITSEVNNTNSPSFELAKSTPSAPRSFGILPKSTINSIPTINSIKDNELTLPEASYFSSRRTDQDFDRITDDHNFVDDYFGFDDDDDDDDDDGDDEKEFANKTTSKETKNAQTTTNNLTKLNTGKNTLQELRAKLKRFLNKPDAEPNESIKKSKVITNDKNKVKKVKTPMNSPAKTIRSPEKMTKSPANKKVIFGDIGEKQKDIRSAFTAKSSDKRKQDNSQDDPTAVLFTEIETVQDRRRSYSRPQRQQKRRISIESNESEGEQHSDDEDYDENGKPSKRAKRRKKTTESNPKEVEELEEFARQINQHFEEVDSFEMVVEKE